MWVCSCVCIVIAYSALTLAPIVVTYSPNWRDHLYPLLIGLSVLLLFEVLPNRSFVTLWYLFASLTSASRIGLSRYIASKMRRLECEDDIKVVIEEFGRSLSRVARFHMGSAAYFIVVYVGLLSIPGLMAWQWVLGGLGVVAMLAVILRLEQTRSDLVKGLG